MRREEYIERKSEAGSGKSEDGRRMLEVGRLKLEVTCPAGHSRQGSQKSEGRSWKTFRFDNATCLPEESDQCSAFSNQSAPLYRMATVTTEQFSWLASSSSIRGGISYGVEVQNYGLTSFSYEVAIASYDSLSFLRERLSYGVEAVIAQKERLKPSVQCSAAVILSEVEGSLAAKQTRKGLQLDSFSDELAMRLADRNRLARVHRAISATLRLCCVGTNKAGCNKAHDEKRGNGCLSITTGTAEISGGRASDANGRTYFANGRLSGAHGDPKVTEGRGYLANGSQKTTEGRGKHAEGRLQLRVSGFQDQRSKFIDQSSKIKVQCSVFSDQSARHSELPAWHWSVGLSECRYLQSRTSKNIRFRTIVSCGFVQSERDTIAHQHGILVETRGHRFTKVACSRVNVGENSEEGGRLSIKGANSRANVGVNFGNGRQIDVKAGVIQENRIWRKSCLQKDFFSTQLPMRLADRNRLARMHRAIDSSIFLSGLRSQRGRLDSSLLDLGSFLSTTKQNNSPSRRVGSNNKISHLSARQLVGVIEPINNRSSFSPPRGSWRGLSNTLKTKTCL